MSEEIVGRAETYKKAKLERRMKGVLFDSGERYRQIVEHVGDTIWTVDMNMKPTHISPSVTQLLGYSVQEAMARPMEEVFTPDSFKFATEVLGEELEKEKRKQKDLARSRSLELELIRKDGSIVPVEINYTFLRDAEAKPVEILAIARDISERKRAQEESKHNTERLVTAMEGTISAMAMIVEIRDPYTAGHQRRVAQLACAIAKEIGLSEDQIIGLRLAGLIHDIGKIRVPIEILINPDGLTAAEFTMIKMHPALGYDILKTMDLPWPIAQTVHQHHERLDGSGYPLGLLAKDIILEAMILAVADVVEAISSHRPYRPARGIDFALDDIWRNKNILFDATIVDACLRLFREKEFKFE
jgi:PAS domain S-box-containing protein/putative nucleotidyltransferase with HDIG domain